MGKGVVKQRIAEWSESSCVRSSTLWSERSSSEQMHRGARGMARWRRQRCSKCLDYLGALGFGDRIQVVVPCAFDRDKVLGWMSQIKKLAAWPQREHFIVRAAGHQYRALHE